MRLQELLDATDVHRQAFHSLRRRGQVRFLDRHLRPSGEGTGRYQSWHVLGVAALRALQRCGLEGRLAADAVESSWPDIIRIAGLVAEPPQDRRCGYRFGDHGQAETFGWPHPEGLGGPVLAEVFVDLTELWTRLQPRLSVIEGRRKASRVE